MGEHLEALAAAESRRERLSAMKAAMVETPPDEDYLAAAQRWQSERWS